jgi:oxepin-CoA hydrolase/3-oxo-5,6-dehydrosuberyl-CoA semialdehyde dehydrogenase
MVNETKKLFLEKQFIPIVRAIDPSVEPRWGKMNLQQMVEHVALFFSISTNKTQFPLTTAEEHLPKYKGFLMSEKEFRENTKAPILPADPLPVRYAIINDAIISLEQEVNDFFGYFKDDPEKRTLHPAFGELNFEEWVQLHHKHVKHHLRQFGKEMLAAV